MAEIVQFPMVAMINAAGCARVLDGKPGMTFLVHAITTRDNGGVIAHVRDYRWPHEIYGEKFQIWSIGPEGYEIVAGGGSGARETLMADVASYLNVGSDDAPEIRAMRLARRIALRGLLEQYEIPKVASLLDDEIPLFREACEKLDGWNA